MSVSSDSALSDHPPSPGEVRGRDLATPGTRRQPTPGVPRIDATDGELLSLFTRHDDRDALDRLIDRHASMVWRVCRQALRRPQDAEDAFQATFLLLIKSAKSIQSSDSAAGWLYRVAYRTSIRTRKQLAARREESLAVDPDAPSEKAFPDLLRKQTTSVLVEELMRLPAKYQTPLVLRYLEGQSRRAIADQTDTTVAAVQGQLARGKQLLRRRLLRRGVSLSAAMATLGLAGRGAQAAEAAPTHVVAQTTSNGVALATGGSLAASAAVVSLYQEGVRAMLLFWIAKPAGAAASIAAVALLAMAPGTVGEAPTASPTSTFQLAADLTNAQEVATPGVEPTEGITLAQANTNRAGASYTEAYSVRDLVKPGANKEERLSILADRLRQEVLGDKDEVGVFAAKQMLVVSGDRGKHQQVAKLLSKVREASKDLRAPDLLAQEKVIAVLKRPLPEGGFNFTETPLYEVLEYLSDEFDIDHHIDQRALDEYGIGADEPVTIRRRSGTIGGALEQMLEPLELRAISHNGALTVTTAEQAAKQLDVRVYSVADLLNSSGITAEQLSETVAKMVEPETWASAGEGKAELTLMAGGLLTVSQSQRGHERLAELLTSLREVSAATASGETARAQQDAAYQAPRVTARPGATGVVTMLAPAGGRVTATTTPQPDGSAKLGLQISDAASKPERLGLQLRQPVSDGLRIKYAQRNSEYGWSVNQLQERLNEVLYPSPGLDSDGDYGPLTTAAVKRFQKHKGLPETGTADAATRAALGFAPASTARGVTAPRSGRPREQVTREQGTQRLENPLGATPPRSDRQATRDELERQAKRLGQALRDVKNQLMSAAENTGDPQKLQEEIEAGKTARAKAYRGVQSALTLVQQQIEELTIAEAQSLADKAHTLVQQTPPDFLLDALVNDAAGPQLDRLTAQRLIDESGAERLRLSKGQSQRAARVFSTLRQNTALQPDMKGFQRDTTLFRTAAGGAWSSGAIKPSQPPTKPLDPKVLIGAMERGVEQMRERAEKALAAGDKKARRDAMEIARRSEDELKRKIDEQGGPNSLELLLQGQTPPTADESLIEILTATLAEARLKLAADEAAGETLKANQGKRYIKLVEERLAEVKTASEAKRAKPTVSQTVPTRGATNIDPGLTEVRITFDRDMRPNGYSFSGMPKSRDGRKPKWVDTRTCVLPVELQPGQSYWVGINADGRTSFKSAEGTPAAFDELRFTTAAANYQYGPDSAMTQGQWNCLHRPTELNPRGWATVAELKVGDHAPIKLPDDARPRPHLKLESVEGGSARFTVVDPGFPEDGEAWDASEPRTIRDVSVETLLLGEGDRDGTHLMVIREAAESGEDPAPAPTPEAAKRLLHEKRPSPSRQALDQTSSRQADVQPSKVSEASITWRPEAAALTPLRPHDGGRDGKYGSRNASYRYSVKQLQSRLNERVVPSPWLKEDGDYGPLTMEAVRQFQRQAKLPATGFADAATRKALGFSEKVERPPAARGRSVPTTSGSLFRPFTPAVKGRTVEGKSFLGGE